MKKQACAKDGCITILSSTNKGPFCWTHTESIGSKLTSTYKGRVERFIENIPRLTSEERGDAY